MEFLSSIRCSKGQLECYQNNMRSFFRTFSCGQAQEALPESDVEGVDRLRLASALLEVPDGLASARASTAALVVIAFYVVEPLHLPDNLQPVLLQ